MVMGPSISTNLIGRISGTSAITLNNSLLKIAKGLQEKEHYSLSGSHYYLEIELGATEAMESEV